VAVSGQSLVSLFNAATDAGEQRDPTALAEARTVAERLAEGLAAACVVDARRLLEHCEELMRANTATPSLQREPSPAVCPICGR
jgi:hypothetical protein